MDTRGECEAFPLTFQHNELLTVPEHCIQTAGSRIQVGTSGGAFNKLAFIENTEARVSILVQYDLGGWGRTVSAAER